MKSYVRYLLLPLLAVSASLGLTQGVSAQSATRLAISPVTFELTANPGDTLTNQIKVTNISSGVLQLNTQVENIANTGEQGQVQLTEEETAFSLSKWVEVTPKTFTINPNESAILTFTIRVPKNAEPGGHYGSILAGTIASEDRNTTGAAVAQRIGSLLLVKVSGQSREQATVTRFVPKTFKGTWEEIIASDGKTKILSARDEDFKQEKIRKYFKQGPIAFDTVFHNSGNVHIKPVGKVIIYNLFNKKVAELPLDSRNVFPGNDRRITIIWPQKNLWGVHYRVQLAAVYGDPSQALTAETSFWAFPLIPAIGIGVGLLMLILLRKRLTRAIRILVRGA